jgi:predicted RNase H-like HicB family nuclease
VGHVEEIPAALAQEHSLEEARASLQEAFRDIIEANRELARREKATGGVILEEIRVAA